MRMMNQTDAITANIINDLLLHTVGRFEFEIYAGPAYVAQTAAGRAPREPECRVERANRPCDFTEM